VNWRFHNCGRDGRITGWRSCDQSLGSDVIRGRCPRNFSALFCEWSRLSAVPPLSPDLRALRPRWPRPDADAGFGTGKRCDHLCRSQRRCSRNVGKACSPGFAANFCILSSQIGAVAAALVPSHAPAGHDRATPCRYQPEQPPHVGAGGGRFMVLKFSLWNRRIELWLWRFR
jgi:hypothetical protein